MKAHLVISGLGLALLMFAPGPQAAERAKAQVNCTPTERDFVYDCMIVLTGRMSDQPLDGAKIVVGADMPTMPMAHNVRPVTAVATGTPGTYHARIELAMFGEWALKIEISGPTRDKIFHTMHFGARAGEDGGQGAGSPKTYQGIGVVMKVDRRKSRLTVDHEEIAGYMKAMVMSYSVTRPWLVRGLREGQKIRFTIDADKRAIVDLAPLRE